MNSSTSRFDRAIDEQASTWAARLDGDVLEASERAALDAWLAESPAHRAALSVYCQFSADLEEQLPALVATGAVQLPAAAPRARRWFTVPRLATFTLAIGAAAAVAVAVFVNRPDPRIQAITTAIAERATHTLADGTRVELNAHTSLHFDNSATERRVRLAGGEALFAVAKDFSRPFIIETPNGSVRVTGTTFNVRNDTGARVSLEVTVVEGSVEVRPSSAANQPPFALTAGEQLSAGAKVNVRDLTPSAVADSLAWREGRLVCDNMPLHEAAARFARFHGRHIAVDPRIADTPVGGVHSIDDLPGFLSALGTMLPVNVSRDDSGVSITPRPGK
jgi:transmembrane sensor